MLTAAYFNILLRLNSHGHYRHTFVGQEWNLEKGYKQDKIFWRNFDTQFKKGIKEFEAEISQKNKDI